MEINADHGDLLIRGFWNRNNNCIIDVHICDVNQASCRTRKPASIIKSAENEKKTQYMKPSEKVAGLALYSTLD